MVSWKNGLGGLLLGVALGAGAWAAPDDRAVVLQARSATVVEQGPLLVGQTLQRGTTLKLDADGEAILLDLARGSRFKLSGPGTVQITAKDFSPKGVKVAPVNGPKTTLQMSGQNFRRLGGIVTRSRPIDPLNRSLSNQLFTHHWRQVKGHTIFSFTYASDGRSALPLKVELLASASTPVLSQSNGGFYFRSDNANPEVLQTFTPTVQVVGPEGGRSYALYSVDLGVLDGKRSSPYGLRIYSDDDSIQGLVLETRFRVLAPEREKQLIQSVETLTAWSRKHPQDISALLTAAGLLDDNDRPGAALNYVNLALKRQPKDLGLQQLKLRLLLDAGLFGQARAYFNEVAPKA